MIEKHSYYEFSIFHDAGLVGDESWSGFIYKIFLPEAPDFIENYIESHEWFETAQEARFAAIGHISKLEDGEG